MAKTVQPLTGKGFSRRDFIKHGAAGLAGTAALGSLPLSSLAQGAYPSRPVTVIVPYSAGGNTDTMARLACQYLSNKLGQNFVVENQPTAGGVVATESVVNAAPDGYQLLFGAATMIIIRPLLQPLNYDADDLLPVSAIGAGPYIIGVRRELGVATLEEMIAYAKEHPGEINYASGGTGGNAHLTTARFAAQAEIDIVEIPYQGGAPASAALLAGEVDMYFGNASELLRMKDDPNVLLLGVSTPERMDQLPDVPAVAEIIPGFVARSWNGFLAPVGTPQEIIDMVAEGTIEAANDPEIRATLVDLGIVPLGTTPAELGELIEADKSFYREAVDIAGLTVT
jgi:tripartite-type tricarboxylate transporter receptor subunit TctC